MSSHPTSNFPELPKPSPITNPFYELSLPKAGGTDLGVGAFTREAGLLPAQRDVLSSLLDNSFPPFQFDLQRKANSEIRYLLDGEIVRIYEFTTSQVVLRIESVDPRLSDEELIEILTSFERMCWCYFISPDQKVHGYYGFGKHAPTSLHDQATPQLHTLIRITWPRHIRIHLPGHLRELTQKGCEQLAFWPALVGAIAATDQAFLEGYSLENNRKTTSLPAFFARLNMQPIPYSGEEPNVRTLKALVSYLTLPQTRGRIAIRPNEFDVCGKAFFWHKLGKALWSPDCVRSFDRLFMALEINPKAYEFFTDVADYWLSLVSFAQIEIIISGVKLKYDLQNMRVIRSLWGQSIELERSKVPPDALRYLHPRHSFTPLTPFHTAVTGYDLAYGDALAKELITEAQERSAYVPAGGFRTALPPSAPLVGIEELCVWTNGKELWVLPLPNGLMFHWQPEPDNYLYLYDGNKDFLSAWNLILAALWHDLVTQGPVVIVHTGDDRSNNIERKAHRRHGRSQSRPNVLHLPSQRVIHMDGVHTWGTPEEIEKIKRQAHQVRGHRRRLLPGHRRSPAAFENASRFNFIIPDGYTFVKPHQTGLTHSANTPTTETPILARGLASLMLMSKDYQSRSAA